MPHPVPAGPAPADPVPTGHAAHDTVLVAAYAAGDADGTELAAATALVAGCAACAALHRDLRAIAAALPELPAPRRTRDFRLTPGQAASLRPAGWRRLLAPFAGPRFAFAAPLGSGLAALGIVGILIAGTGLPLGGTTSLAVPAVAPAAAPTAAPAAGGLPTADDGPMGVAGVAAPSASTVQAPAAGPGGSAGPLGPEGSSGAAAPAGGVATARPDKNAAPAASPASIPGAAASNPAASPASVPGAAAGGSPGGAPGGTGEADRAMGARDQAAGVPWNALMLTLALAMIVSGVVLAGLRFVSRRVA